MASLGEKELEKRGVEFVAREYDFRKKGAQAAAEALEVPLSATIKTLVVRLSDDRHVFVLLPGDATISLRNLARSLELKSAELATERDAERLTGYRVGGIAPFASRTPLPVFADLALLDHERVLINGGRRGLLLELDPEQLIEATDAELIDVSR